VTRRTDQHNWARLMAFTALCLNAGERPRYRNIHLGRSFKRLLKGQIRNDLGQVIARRFVRIHARSLGFPEQ